MKVIISTLALGLLLAAAVPAAADDAEALYKSKCQMCHGADGKGSGAGQKMGVRDFHAPEVAKESDAPTRFRLSPLLASLILHDWRVITALFIVKIPSPRKSGNRIFTTETRRHGEQQESFETQRNERSDEASPSFAKAAKGWATR